MFWKLFNIYFSEFFSLYVEEKYWSEMFLFDWLFQKSKKRKKVGEKNLELSFSFPTLNFISDP